MTLKEIYAKAKQNGYNDVARFMRDMKRAGLVKHMKYYEGRYFWTGPAVVVDNIQVVLSHTKVKCQWDSMGLGYVVYPRQSINISRQIFGH